MALIFVSRAAWAETCPRASDVQVLLGVYRAYGRWDLRGRTCNAGLLPGKILEKRTPLLPGGRRRSRPGIS